MSKLVCMTGSTADRAAAELLEQQAALFAERFPRRFLARAEELAQSAVSEKPQLPDFAENAVSIEAGGLWAALWKLGEAAKTGLNVDAAAIPIRQETVEICEELELDPYGLPSIGAVFLCEPQAVLEETEATDGQPAFIVIGKTTKAAARTVRIGDRIRYLNRSTQ